MKKIIITIIIMLGLMALPIKANTQKPNKVLICEVGCGSDEELIIEDYQVIDSNVNWDVVGDYEVTYLNQSNRTYFTRLVKIVSKNQLDNGIDLYYDFLRTKKDSLYHISDYLKISTEQMVLVGRVETREINYSINFPSEYGFIEYYENNTLVWDKTFDNYSEVRTIKPSKAGFVCLLSFYNGNDTDLKVLELNLDGEVIRDLVIHGNDYDYAKDLIVTDDKLYIACTSSSTIGDINDTHQHQFVGIIKIDYESFTIEKQIALGNSGYNNFKDLEYDEYLNTIWVMMEAYGTYGGLTNRNGEYKGVFVICLDSNLNIVKYREFSILGDLYFFYINANELIIFYTPLIEQQKVIHANVYSDEFYYKNTMTWGSTSTDYYLEPIKMKQNLINKYVIMYNKVSSSATTFGGLIVFNKTPTAYNYQGLEKGICGYVNEDNSIDFIGQNSQEVVAKEFISVKENLISNDTYNYETYPCYYCMINFKQAFILGTPKTQDVFGDYLENYTCQLPYLSLIVSDRYYVADVINITSGQVYDVGIVLRFNGEGYLNDQKISSGYTVSKAGQYTLVVVGNNARKVVDFTVKPLSIEGNPQPISTITVETIEIGKNGENKEDIITIDENLITSEEPTGTIYSVIIATVLTAIGLLFPLKRRKK